MNKSKIASNIVGDIYTFHDKYEKSKHKFENGEISATKFANAQYVIMAKAIYLSEVIDQLKELGYQFTRYEKEVCFLADLIESMGTTLNQTQLSELSAIEQFSLVTYLTKYKNIVSVSDDETIDLKDEV